MKIWEFLVISFGITIDVFAVTICWGAMLQKVDRVWLAKTSCLVALWESAALLAGQLLAVLPLWHGRGEAISLLGRGLSIFLLVGLGLYMFFKAYRAKPLQETRISGYAMKYVFLAALAMSVDAYLAGMGMGLLGALPVFSTLCFFIITILSVIVGIYCGYWIGCEQRKGAYYVGGILLLLSGAEVFLVHVL